VGPARTQLHGKTVFFNEHLDATPLPIGERLEEIVQVGNPRIGAAGKVRSSDGWVHEFADSREIVSVTGLQVVGEPLAHLPRLHLPIIGRRRESRAGVRLNEGDGIAVRVFEGSHRYGEHGFRIDR